MTLATVQDPLATWPGWATLDLDNTGSELSLQGSGRVRTRELLPPYWILKAQSRMLMPNDFRAWKARLNGLENGLQRFWAYDMVSRYPIRYPNGSWPTGVAYNGATSTLNTVTNAKSIRIAGMPVGFVISIGDFFSWSYGSGPSQALHQAVETVTVPAGGLSPLFEVRPYVEPGYSLGTLVLVKQPRALMVLLPGSVSASADQISGRGTISFQGIQVPDAIV